MATQNITDARKCVYVIRCHANGKVYVGSALRLKPRWTRHLKDLRSGVHHSKFLQRAWNKYGEAAFEFSVLEVAESEDALLEVEQRWLDYFRSYDPKKGFNICPTAGSPRGLKYTEERKKRVSEQRKKLAATDPRWIAHMNNLHAMARGRPMKEEQKQKQRDRLKGKPIADWTPESRAKASATHKARWDEKLREENGTKVKAKWQDPEYRVKVANGVKAFLDSTLVHPNKGRKWTAEQKAKLKGRPSSFKGKKHTEEARRKIGEKSTGRQASETARQKMSEKRKGKPLSEAHRLAVSRGLRNSPNRCPPEFTEEQRKKISEATKTALAERMRDPEFAARRSKNATDTNNRRWAAHREAKRKESNQQEIQF